MFAFLFPRLKDSRYATTQSVCVPRLLFSTKNSRQPSTCGRCLPSTRGVDCSTFSQREKTPMCQSDRISRTLLCKHREKIFYRLSPRSHRCPMVTPVSCFAVICPCSCFFLLETIFLIRVTHVAQENVMRREPGQREREGMGDAG